MRIIEMSFLHFIISIIVVNSSTIVKKRIYYNPLHHEYLRESDGNCLIGVKMRGMHYLEDCMYAEARASQMM